jgi:hypothetical protein
MGDGMVISRSRVVACGAGGRLGTGITYHIVRESHSSGTELRLSWWGTRRLAGARFAALKKTGATAKHKWLNWFAVFLLIVIPVQFRQSNVQNHGDFFPGFLAGLIAAVFLLGAFVVIRQGVRALREL